jgi:hypothetical protein
MNAPLLTTADAARYLGIRPQTLRTWRLSGRGPAYVRLGTGKFARAAYAEDELERWISARSFTSTSDETTKAAAGSAA